MEQKKIYNCDYCEKYYPTRKSLNRHKRCKHENKWCKYCYDGFDNLEKHELKCSKNPAKKDLEKEKMKNALKQCLENLKNVEKDYEIKKIFSLLF